MPLLASVHVNFRPLHGTWDGHHWDQQAARCSNNFLSGSNPPVSPAGVAALSWQIDSPEANAISFNVSVDLPGDDDIIFTGLTNGVETTYLPTPAPNGKGQDGTPFYNGHRWDQYYQRGIYIASVSGATAPFTLNLIGTSGAAASSRGPRQGG